MEGLEGNKKQLKYSQHSVRYTTPTTTTVTTNTICGWSVTGERPGLWPHDAPLPHHSNRFCVRYGATWLPLHRKYSRWSPSIGNWLGCRTMELLCGYEYITMTGKISRSMIAEMENTDHLGTFMVSRLSLQHRKTYRGRSPASHEVLLDCQERLVIHYQIL